MTTLSFFITIPVPITGTVGTGNIFLLIIPTTVQDLFPCLKLIIKVGTVLSVLIDKLYFSEHPWYPGTLLYLKIIIIIN